MRMEFASIASGSSGNCIYIASAHTRLLVDAGLSGKRIEAGLASLSLTGYDIDAMFSGQEDQWDITLFTCTLNGQSRVTVRALLDE